MKTKIFAYFQICISVPLTKICLILNMSCSEAVVRRRYVKKVLGEFHKIHEKTPVPESFF